MARAPRSRQRHRDVEPLDDKALNEFFAGVQDTRAVPDYAGAKDTGQPSFGRTPNPARSGTSSAESSTKADVETQAKKTSGGKK